MEDNLKIELESNAKDKKIISLESDLRKARESLDKSNTELTDFKKRFQQLSSEIERMKQIESKISDSLLHRTNQLDLTIFHLEESKNEIATLQDKIKSLETENRDASELRKKCRIAIESEEKSTKAMDDLALALKEVTTESNLIKENLRTKETEFEDLKVELERLSRIAMESREESEGCKKTIDRLRQEAEESLLALNGKEMGFVNCIKLAEEEKAKAQRESHRLSESLKAAENMTRAAREETYKLRDMLKHTVTESNSAKSAVSIMKDENSFLKESLSEKEESLHFLTKENERLRISEAACHENVKQLKILLSRSGCSSELKSEEYYDFEEELKHEEIIENKMRKSFSFNLEDLRFMREPETVVLDEDPVKAEALKGSIFDTNAETPRSEVRTPKARGQSEVGGKRLEDFDLDSGPERLTHRRAKTMFQRVGDLLAMRRIYHRKEASPGTSEHGVSNNPS